VDEQSGESEEEVVMGEVDNVLYYRQRRQSYGCTGN